MGVLVDVLVIAAVVAFWVVWILATARALRAPASAYAAVGRRKPQTVLLVVQRELTAASDQDAAPA